MAEPRACPDCLRRSWLLALLGPYIEKIATGAVGSRSPELLRLCNEDLVAAAAPKVAGQLLGRVAALTSATWRRSWRRRSAGPAAAMATSTRPGCATPPTRPGR